MISEQKNQDIRSSQCDSVKTEGNKLTMVLMRNTSFDLRTIRTRNVFNILEKGNVMLAW